MVHNIIGDVRLVTVSNVSFFSVYVAVRNWKDLLHVSSFRMCDLCVACFIIANTHTVVVGVVGKCNTPERSILSTRKLICAQ